MNTPRDKSYDDSLTAALTDPDEAAAYLDAVVELEDPAALVVALQKVLHTVGLRLSVQPLTHA
jgi:DNA-binding phage protein